MKSVILRGFYISIVVAVLAAVCANFLSATYHQSSSVTGESTVLYGFDAVQAMIDAFGVFGYLRSLMGSFVLFFAAVFLGCTWSGVLLLRKSQK